MFEEIAIITPLTAWAALANVGIALAYLAIDIFVAPKFEFGAIRSGHYGLRAMQLAALVFFLTCGMTHVDLALHILSDAPPWMLTPHFLLIHTSQALAAPVFLVLAHRFSIIRIGPRRPGPARSEAPAKDGAP